MQDPLAYLVTFRCHRPLTGSELSYSLGKFRREAVLESIRRVCRRRGWTLRAAGVRQDHADAVVVATEAPASVIHAFECYATRLLHQQADRAPKRWAHADATRYLWRKEDVAAAVHYVTAGEGAVFRGQPPRRLGKWGGLGVKYADPNLTWRAA